MFFVIFILIGSSFVPILMLLMHDNRLRRTHDNIFADQRHSQSAKVGGQTGRARALALPARSGC